MQRLNGSIVFSASDLVGHLACEHLTRLELSAVRGERTRPEREDVELAVLTRRGTEHEQRYLESLRAAGLQVACIEAGGIRQDGIAVSGLQPGGTAPPAAEESLRDRAARTLAAMRGGADAVYQAVLFDGTWLGYADFLQRVNRPSALGDFSYEVADTKLARRVKAGTLLQLCVYSEQLARLQGLMPARMHVVLGGMDRQSFALSDFTAYHRRVKSRFEEFVSTAIVQLSAGQPVATYPDPVEHCAVCRWLDTCL
nr:hypothetical protein [Gemmatimonadota bacterium]